MTGSRYKDEFFTLVGAEIDHWEKLLDKFFTLGIEESPKVICTLFETFTLLISTFRNYKLIFSH